MLRWLTLSVLVSVGGVALACGSSQSSDTNSGCKPGSSCDTCGNCYELCLCTTGDGNGCQVACGVTNVGGGGGTGGGYPTGGSGGGDTGGSGGTQPAGGLATALAISEIAMFQAVKVPLMQGGGEPPKKAPVVADREGVIRVYVAPDPEYQPREIIARVELGGSAPGTFDAKAFIGGPSSEADPNSTLNVSIPGQNIKPDTTYTVSLLEATNGSYPGMNGGAKWGASPLGAQSTNGPLLVVLVPVSINGIVPKTDATSIKAYNDRLMKLFPVPNLDIQVRQTAIYTGTVPQKNGSGWNSLLNFLMQLRAFDKPPARAYYYGLVTPAQSFQEYCGFGCVAGLSNGLYYQGAEKDIQGRVGSGVGFFPSGATPSSSDTAAHEIGHTLGMAHAPCVPPGSQIQGVDPNYPYAGAKIGNWGWDIFTKNFLDQNKYTDIMAYCDPTWVSDYTFNRIFNRVAYSNATGDVLSADPERAPGRFVSLLVGDDGSFEWGYPIDTSSPLMSPKKTLELLDASGKLVGTATGFWMPHGHGSGGTLLVRETLLKSQPGAQSVKLTGQKLALPL